MSMSTVFAFTGGSRWLSACLFIGLSLFALSLSLWFVLFLSLSLSLSLSISRALLVDVCLLSFSVSLSFSFCPSLFLSLCRSLSFAAVCLTMSDFRSVCLSSLTVCLSAVPLPPGRSVCLSVCLSVSLSVSLSLALSVCLSFCYLRIWALQARAALQVARQALSIPAIAREAPEPEPAAEEKALGKVLVREFPLCWREGLIAKSPLRVASVITGSVMFADLC